MSEIAANSEPTKVRYHGLDALRAWAMSMGIVLHAAWIMVPGEAGAPKTDADASIFTEFVCLAIHTFRMQLFFVLAGLFACLLIRRRGWFKFSTNRFMRIGLPLMLFWIVLCPIMVYQYNLGGIQSGAIQGDATAWEMTRDFFLALSPQAVMLIHLWFIYYLCLTYVLVILARGILCAVDRRETLRNWISTMCGRLLTTPWAAFVLALVFAPSLLSMKTVWGIEIDAVSLVPKWTGLLSYVLYFCVGWMIYRNIDKLEQITRGWRWQLALGCALIVPYFFYAKHAQYNGYTTWDYPQLSVEDLAYDHSKNQPDYATFRQQLLDAEPETIAGQVWSRIPEPYQQFVSEHTSASDNQIAGVLKQINTLVLTDPELSNETNLASLALTDQARQFADIATSKRSANETLLLNREILECGFAGSLLVEDARRPNYWIQRALYAYGYSVITWLMIFGCIGFSQHFFARESRFWRYFSDSSYWMYLAHLPIQFALLTWFGDLTWHWSVKFSVYILLTLAILVPSYHLLVRPTWLGWLLNGRRYSTKPKSAEQTEGLAGKAAPV